ncbi:hypothetical protein I350_06343 [Cryptococcus amylolentus CBS 6273]|uniref:Oxidase FUB9 n=1 Tax=Cryptococcus amylolentus CBS 6273 TaxID=1296118 RepID=A0A1E3JL29_9TREE|nr:hypothetical protein I350_06343 [Cryptococcus amylolentus CBS 6273]
MAGRAAALDDKVFCIADMQEAARANLPKKNLDYIEGGAMDLITLNDNMNSFNRYRLLPRVMKDVNDVDTSSECWGVKASCRFSSFPMGFSPTGLHGVAHSDRELGTSRAAAKNGINMCLSSWANSGVQEVVDQGAQYSNAYGMQLSVVKDPEINLYVMRNAEAAGCKVLWITVDLPILGRRLNEYRNKFQVPDGLDMPIFPPGANWRDTAADPRMAYDRGLTWERVKWFKENTKMEIWLKGIMDPEDAKLAVEAGADGIVVSNHGGRQLDGISSTLSALPGVVDAVAGRIPVHFDGGIRRGTDIFKALALGADHVFAGRVALYGLAYNGEAGVDLAIRMLQREFLETMIMVGVNKVKDIGRHHLAIVNADGSLSRLKD